MTDLAEQIVRTLRERAEGDVDTDRLLRGSRARGRRRQLHRKVAAGAALSLVGALGLVGVTGSGLDGLAGRMPWTTATPAVVPPVPPRADGVPGAAADPALVGADPQVLHLGVDPARARYLGWEVIRDQVETVRLGVPGGEPVRVDVARSAELPTSVEIDGVSFDATEPGPQTFDGRVRSTAGMPRGLVKMWQPAPGLYARAVMLHGDRAVLEQAVDALRWNEARRCAGPLRLDALPQRARVTVCSVDITSYPRLVTARFALQRADTETMSVQYRYASGAGAQTGADRTIAGRPAVLSAKGTRLELVGVPGTTVVADFGWPWHGEAPPHIFTEADATLLLAGVKFPADPTRPESWE
ncbi:hypothetical protein JNW91_07275 [Micromonospora sp. STR1_7]|uniref:Uncharacterized protein n=1 Tax=Micromonospora parastrephiae TaxID=2806101 RepID=A0ABS1XQZ0_9ACTN|nr:hypothetical protein [Micromonospora parastrephiae]MBM0231676.1 hypothetical protein [Micromonospora parastrephiae]